MLTITETLKPCFTRRLNNQVSYNHASPLSLYAPSKMHFLPPECVARCFSPRNQRACRLIFNSSRCADVYLIIEVWAADENNEIGGGRKWEAVGQECVNGRMCIHRCLLCEVVPLEIGAPGLPRVSYRLSIVLCYRAAAMDQAGTDFLPSSIDFATRKIIPSVKLCISFPIRTSCVSNF